MKKFFDYSLFNIENYHLKVYSILLVVLLIIVLNIILRLIKKSLYSTSKIEVAKRYALYSLVKYVVIVFSIVASFQILGFNLSLLLAGSAALLVGIGLGLQNIFSDFVSGIILLVESKIKVDDILEVKGLVCRVLEINIRTTTVLTRDDKYIILPNTDLTKNQIINWTYTKVASRFEVSIGVGYSSDIKLVNEILKDIIDHQDGALKKPVPFVRFEDFGSSSLQFAIYFWAEEVYGVENIKSEIRTKIFEKFNENHIEIPFPQSVVHLTKNES